MGFSSPLTLYKIAFLLLVSSCLLSYLLTPLAKKMAERFDILDEPNSNRKIHARPIPLLGGVAIFVSFLITLGFLYLITTYFFSIGGPRYFIFKEKNIFWLRVALYLIGAVMIVLTGMLDDLKSIDFKPKLFVQILAALIVIFSGSHLTLFPWHIANIAISCLWIVCLTNSFNLLDNMNGLSTGLSIIIIFFYIVITYLTNHYLLAMFLLIPLGCLLGFIPYNFPRAQIFLGDTGSLFNGFSLATYSIWIFDHLFKQTSSWWSPFVSLMLLLSIPIIDTLTVIAIRLKNQKPIYIGDTNHLSHQLVRLGFSQAGSVLILYASCLAIGTMGLLYLLT